MGIDPEVYEKAKSFHQERKRDRSNLNILRGNSRKLIMEGKAGVYWFIILIENGNIDYKKSLGHILGVKEDSKAEQQPLQDQVQGRGDGDGHESDEESKHDLSPPEAEIRIGELIKHTPDENQGTRKKTIIDKLSNEIENGEDRVNDNNSRDRINNEPALVNESNRSQIIVEANV